MPPRRDLSVSRCGDDNDAAMDALVRDATQVDSSETQDTGDGDGDVEDGVDGAEDDMDLFGVGYDIGVEAVDSSCSSSSCKKRVRDAADESYTAFSKVAKSGDGESTHHQTGCDTDTTSGGITVRSLDPDLHFIVMTHAQAAERFSLFADLRPSTVVLYDPDVAVVRAVEAYQTTTTLPMKLYFMLYGKSAYSTVQVWVLLWLI